ncbi:MAG TPA: 3-oxoacyl-ACP synthase, partial [Bacteroidetes bacterium]|nr:3-oxoacyl-ACP synthase [Bacteroidota bacterium]
KSYGLAVGTEGMSIVTDYSDRSTCVLFGDGAGAAVIGPVASGEILATYTRTQGKYAGLLELDKFMHVPLTDQREMRFQRLEVTNYPYLRMEGPKVFAVAVRTMVSDVRMVIERYNRANGQQLTEADIDYVYPHQANLRIVRAVGEALKLTPDKVYSDGVKNYGNTSAASIPIGYIDNLGKHRGNTEVDVAFGAGFASGAILRKVAE